MLVSILQRISQVSQSSVGSLSDWDRDGHDGWMRDHDLPTSGSVWMHDVHEATARDDEWTHRGAHGVWFRSHGDEIPPSFPVHGMSLSTTYAQVGLVADVLVRLKQ